MKKLEYIFKKKYNRLILNKLNLKTIHELPTVDSIYINLGLSNSKSIKLNVLVLYTALYIITGQKPVPTMSLNSISNFKLRKGQLIGLKCTLRRKRKWIFLSKLSALISNNKKQHSLLSTNSKVSSMGQFTFTLKNLLGFIEVKKSIFIPKSYIPNIGISITIDVSSSSIQYNKMIVDLIGI